MVRGELAHVKGEVEALEKKIKEAEEREKDLQERLTNPDQEWKASFVAFAQMKALMSRAIYKHRRIALRAACNFFKIAFPDKKVEKIVWKMGEKDPREINIDDPPTESDLDGGDDDDDDDDFDDDDDEVESQDGAGLQQEAEDQDVTMGGQQVPIP